ncbi:MAG: phosphatidate cytidylyltransferase [Hyphomicrobium sp.]|jgi:phosphatidate cytidylyltransferase|uniref:phosphatidate cytidylyltransferase n=1 Tax=Hyphomicrobium sp. TaxID=82 RepID=UPI0025BFA47C|nr:phosphatidate cytidylyltransferase [Hyphomicrobium sp.]MBX9861848.1 phosphatidate cytidylyltransferase [Hyphomicrobium sp.]
METDQIVEDSQDLPPARRSPTDLWKRVLSGLLLAGAAFGLAWAGLLPFAAFVLVVAIAMSWEWSRVVRGAGIDLTLVVHAIAVTAAVALAAFGFVALGVAVLLIGTIIVLALEFGSHPLLSATGVMYAGLPAVALLWLRSDEPRGFLAILFIVLVVAATDTAAFAAGRLIGGPRLAPRVSPNKTWSGLAGGVSAAAGVAAAFAVVIGAPVVPLAIVGLLMGLLAQAGDLAESALKRAFDVKDASQLLPGHGGFMDRMDGLVTVSVAVAIAALFLNPQAPAHALLSGLSLSAP